jgi:hypothetical protein
MFYLRRMGYVSGDNDVIPVRDSSVRCFILGEWNISGDNDVRSVRDCSVRCFIVGEWGMFQWTMMSDL